MPGSDFRNVLCIRADNMGDVIMASAAIRALKESFGSRVTLLTSSAGSLISPYLECVDDTIVCDLPWVQSAGCGGDTLTALAEDIRSRNFDAAFIFTVYSQSSLPAAMLAYLAGIPVRVAYARENPYQLLTDWVPDPEPYDYILHQVERDLRLVAHVGAKTADDQLRLRVPVGERVSVNQKLKDFNISEDQPYMIFHPGVSDLKREYPAGLWIAAGRLVAEKYNVRILLTGSASDQMLAESIAEGIGAQAIPVAGLFSVGEFISLIGKAHSVVSVNTATIHMAAAMQTPVVVLYAQTNPQHTPWKSEHRVLPYSVPEHLQSRNIIIKYVTDRHYIEKVPFPTPGDILFALGSFSFNSYSSTHQP